MTEVSKTLAPAANGSIVVGRHDRWFRSTVTDWTKFSNIGIMFLLLLAALIVRAPTFGNPVLHVDETFYFTVAREMLRGDLVYVDIWDRKPIGLFLIYLVPALAGVKLGILAYQALALAAVVATAALIVRLAKAVGWHRGALPAALAYILWLNLADGQGGQSPVFYNFLTAAAACQMVIASRCEQERGRLIHGLLAMFLMGLVLQIKYSAVFEGMFFGLWLMWMDWRSGVALRPTLMRGTTLAGTALIPTAVVGIYYAAIGHWSDFYFANFISILSRGSDPFSDLVKNLLEITLILAPLVVLAFWGMRLDLATKHSRNDMPRLFMFGWLIAALGGLLIFGTWASHYALPVMLPAACCAAAFFAIHRRGMETAIAVLLIFGIAGQVLVAKKQSRRGDSEQAEAITRAIGSGPGCLYVYSRNTIFYALTGRCHVGKYVFSSHLNRTRENGATGASQLKEIAAVFAHRPEVVMMEDSSKVERLKIRSYAKRMLRRYYRLQAKLPLGKGIASIYRLRK